MDVEEDAFLEIAELLDTQHGDKYALMVLRSGDDLEHASIVQVQMLEDDSMDTVRQVLPSTSILLTHCPSCAV